ncbi:alanine--glyoxylate aminotransferase 2 homolog 1, mitochondrial [Tanacetum coccineum]
MHGAKNADYGVNILTNSNFRDGTNGWFPLGNFRLGVVKNGSPHLVPHAARDTLSGHCIHATNRSYTWMGPTQIMTDKVKLCHVPVINDDTWHEICGSIRIKKQPSKVKVYIQGPSPGINFMVAGFRIFVVVYFVNSRTKANELAMLMARLYSGNLGIIALRNYHGGSAATMGLTALNTWKYPIPQSENKERHGAKEQIIWNFDSTLGIGGAVALAPGYLKLVYDMVRKAGGICIADEVQTGFGNRKWFTLRSCGYYTKNSTSNVSKIQFNTFGGNPVCSAGGLEVLKVLDKENRQKHCADVGSHMIGRLKDLQQKHDIIEDVRGRGLMVGVELVTDRKEKTPAKAKTAVLLEKLRGTLKE